MNWTDIRTVFLDMDGTLLDLHFDNYFWREYLPARYARERNVSLEAAQAELADRYTRVEGTLQWYCVDYWTAELGLDIPKLKEEVKHLIALHPFALEFLAALRSRNIHTLLLTNAHRKTLSLKMRCTGLDRHFDRLICSHDFGLTKENAGFWPLLQQSERFQPDSTLLIDDSLPVLRAARDFGIAHLLTILRPDSRQPVRQVDGFAAILSFQDILEGFNL